MQRDVELVLTPAQAQDRTIITVQACLATGLDPNQVQGTLMLRRSIDGRSKVPRIRAKVRLFIDEPVVHVELPSTQLPDVSGKAAVHIVGCGPAGLFAAIEAARSGLRPVIIERGKKVRDRRRDVAAISKEHIVDPNSNYCFGEGGAGTFSDGKLYTRSHKRGNIENVLRTFVAYGASTDILADAHPHIGTNKLPAIITAMREAIETAGGEVRFDTRVTDLQVADGHIRAIELNDQEVIPVERLILATGHSARDIFELLATRKIRIEAKPFAMGVRIEHPQEVIDMIQYHCSPRDQNLPPASYRSAVQVDGTGVYSFCMCPGGIIAPCATNANEIVTNGWSPSKRNNPFANSGIVTEVQVPDVNDPLSAMRFQAEVERAAWTSIGAGQRAPAQRMTDLIEGRDTSSLPPCSYPPGVEARRLDQILPESVSKAIRRGLQIMSARMKGYLTEEAIVVAVESRTSSPVRIPRDHTTLEHPEVKGLYPCGEGAGFAGGIVSAAMDGERCARMCATHYPA